ncbi:Glycerophosphoryl diester phosphodiesterase [Blastopirellula retiformator]|uniref:Glycerophosphoryl diester phosphodiesterase n=2 Tax=Blastopirellula retiformator TaxID=2527970 RepID=A0A5C5USQ9_9BACT|nr:Glycerophosphoryl diester phosphodiesterase [Blastopirellula retiformator]
MLRFESRMFSLVWAAVALVAGFGAASQASAGDARVKRILETKEPLVIGHRGASAFAPENTIPSFQLAIEQKADLVELDYYHSADGVPFCIHDKTYDRTTNANQQWKSKKTEIAAKDWSDIAGLDAGSWFDAKFAGVNVPKLDQAIEAIQAGSVTLIEHKQGDADTLIQLLKERDWTDKLVVQSFDWDFVARCAELEPSLAIAALGSDKLTAERIAPIVDKVEVIAWNYKFVDKAAADMVHKQGKKLFVYTVNDPQMAKQLVELGVDGIITDRPGEIGAAIRK